MKLSFETTATAPSFPAEAIDHALLKFVCNGVRRAMLYTRDEDGLSVAEARALEQLGLAEVKQAAHKPTSRECYRVVLRYAGVVRREQVAHRAGIHPPAYGARVG